MNLSLEQDLINLRDELKEASEREWNYASMSENKTEEILELSYSKELLRFSNKLRDIIDYERNRKFR